MEMPTQEEITALLSLVEDPELQHNIVDLGYVEDIRIGDAAVDITLRLSKPVTPLRKAIGDDAKTRLTDALGPNVEVQVDVVGPQPASAQRAAQQSAQQKGPGKPAGVQHVIAVASGKGGVGKSTVATNLAVALAQSGASVGLMDADVYGPSVPTMMGVDEKPGFADGKVYPVQAHGVLLMSIGFVVDDDDAMIWRGPMASGAINQFISDVVWGELDYLILDLPPGTGDIQLTIVQKLKLTGAIVVTTPQEVALADVRRANGMFTKVDVPVLGIVENMSYFVCPGCGHREEIFAHGGGRTAAEQMGVPFLGELPLAYGVRAAGDIGIPVVRAEPESEQAAAFTRIAAELSRVLADRA